MSASRVTCPCCGHRTLDPDTQWDLCPVCYWEDDPHQSDDPRKADGANGYSLIEGQRMYAALGTSHPIFAAKVRPARRSEPLDPDWRAVSDAP